MKFHRIQPYRDVCIAELRSEDYIGGKPFYVLDGGVEVHTAYYVVDDVGDVVHPIQAYFLSPLWAMRAADFYIDNPKMFEAKVSALLRSEKKFFDDF